MDMWSVESLVCDPDATVRTTCDNARGFGSTWYQNPNFNG